MIKVLIGNMFESQAQTLVNTVNCVGVMGKGIAKEFKKRFPDMFRDYAERCKRGDVNPGVPYIYTDLLGNSIVNFPTKDHWRSPSKLEDVIRGLDIFADKYHEWGIKSVAFPPLGCGNGGLEWRAVGPLMYQNCRNLILTLSFTLRSARREENCPPSSSHRRQLPRRAPEALFKAKCAKNGSRFWKCCGNRRDSRTPRLSGEQFFRKSVTRSRSRESIRGSISGREATGHSPPK